MLRFDAPQRVVPPPVVPAPTRVAHANNAQHASLLAPRLLPSRARHVDIIAHRASADHPNSLQGIADSIRSGADGAEIDVHQTYDGKTIVHHDARMFGLLIRKATLNELQKVAATRGKPIYPLLAMLQKVATSPEMHINVEIKHAHSVQDVLDCVTDSGILPEKVLFTSFKLPILAAIKRESSTSRLGLILNPYQHFGIANTLLRAKRIGIEMIAAAPITLSKKTILIAKRHRLKIAAWTVNNAVVIQRLVRAGVNQIITDHPIEAREAIQDVTLETASQLALPNKQRTPQQGMLLGLVHGFHDYYIGRLWV